MNEEEIRQLVFRALSEVAPEADTGSIGPEESLQEQLDIDSLDFLNFVMALSEATGLEIRERDYPKVGTLNGCVDYLSAAQAAAG